MNQPDFVSGRPCDLAVVGAGAAGLMTGIMASRAGLAVKVFDSQRIIGAKIVVSGGGRCNVTNAVVVPGRFNGGSPQFIGRVLRSFSVEDTHRFFDGLDVPLKLEPTGKFFPKSDSSRTVLAALVEALRASGAELITESAVLDLVPRADGWEVVLNSGLVPARAVALCTGGLALPRSGSDGRGYAFATKFGHTIVPTTPALSPLLAASAPHAGLAGVTLPVRLKLSHCARPVEFEGSFLFTHVGYSGPAALNLSRHVAHERPLHPDAAVTVSLLPQVPAQEEAAWWQEFQRTQSRRTLVNGLRQLLPVRLAERIAIESRIPLTLNVGKLEKHHSLAARNLLFAMPLPVTEVADYAKAEATAGGVDLAEIEPATMMSRLVPGLFLAGEVCDVDGWLGGYNFQWAWSSGTVAGRGAARYVSKMAAD